MDDKGVVEALCRYAETDLVVPAGGWADEAAANADARCWCAEVNARVHSEIVAVPDDRLAEERTVLRPLPSLRPLLQRGETRKVDKLATVRFGSARYSVPRELVGRGVEVAVAGEEIHIHHGDELLAVHPVVAPGECSIIDDHYGGPRRAPARAVRPRTGAERAFLALGPAAESFLRSAAAAGTSKLGTELALITALEAAWGRDAVVAALERAAAFHRFRAADVRSIREAGPGLPSVVDEGEALVLDLPSVPVRSLQDYRIGDPG